MPTIDKYGNLYTIAVDTTCCPYYKLLISLNNAGDFRWKYTFKDEESDDFWQPLICDSEGTVYVGSTFGNYYYAISSAGELKWKLPLNGYQVDNTGAIAEDGTLYLGVHLTSLHPNQKQTLLAIRDTNVVSLSGDDPVLSSLALKQNYPNPFNSRTKISFTIPQSGHVSLKVFDISGKEVVNLVDGFRFRGEYFELFDDSNLTSGIYVYRLKIGKFTSTKKMILVK